MTKETTQLSMFDTDPGTQMFEYKISVEQIQDELAKYGLTDNQSKVFIYLGKYGSKTAPEVCKALKLPRTETYHLLSSLQSKGIVFATFQHPIQFTALPIDKAILVLVNSEKERIKSLERNEKQLTEMWGSIPNFDTAKTDDEFKFQILHGTNQIFSKITEMTDTHSKKFMILGSEKDFLKLYHGDFLEPFVESKKEFYMLSTCTEKTLYIFDELDRKNIRLLDNAKEHPCFILKDSSELLFFTKNIGDSTAPVALWTNSPAMITSMELLFESLWANSKKMHI
ncbi:MAG: helix-turn-helix domain-containing protein [Candidatus Nitrosotenuis sp.]